MHCELIVPGLFAESSGARAAALELLLARGRASTAESVSVETWLRERFGLDDEPIAAGALTIAASGGDPEGHRWARADPVHLRLLRDRLIVVPSAAFTLAAEEADRLVESLNAHFGDRLWLTAVDPACWCARLDRELVFNAPSPLDAAGRDVDLALRVGGEAGKRWAKLLNEIQMLLHAHPVNQAREARGEPMVNSLWLWGAGTAPAPVSRWQSVSADDPVARGLARLAGTRTLPLARNAGALLDSLEGEGRHLVLLDALRAPLALGERARHGECIEALETTWFAPLLAELRAGRLGMVTLHVPDSLGAVFEIIRGDLRRFWRRRKALENYA